jgi:hypothetical protein
MAYIRLSTLEYPVYEGDIRREHEEIREDQTGDNFPCPEGFAKVEHTDPPTPAPNTKYECAGPYFDGQKWVLSWKSVLLTDEDRKSESMYAETEENSKIIREKIHASSFMAAPSGAFRDAWAKYHDELVAYHESYPRSGNFPKPPVFDEAGNAISLNNSGTAPNVIG